MSGPLRGSWIQLPRARGHPGWRCMLRTAQEHRGQRASTETLGDALASPSRAPHTVFPTSTLPSLFVPALTHSPPPARASPATSTAAFPLLDGEGPQAQPPHQPTLPLGCYFCARSSLQDPEVHSCLLPGQTTSQRRRKEPQSSSQLKSCLGHECEQDELGLRSLARMPCSGD